MNCLLLLLSLELRESTDVNKQEDEMGLYVRYTMKYLSLSSTEPRYCKVYKEL